MKRNVFLHGELQRAMRKTQLTIPAKIGLDVKKSAKKETSEGMKKQIT
jgi:hypothetical protein